MASQPVSYVKAHLAEVLASVRMTREPVVITQNGEGAAVLQDLETFERGRRALALLKVLAMGEADLQRGRVRGQADVFAALRARLPKAGARPGRVR